MTNIPEFVATNLRFAPAEQLSVPFWSQPTHELPTIEMRPLFDLHAIEGLNRFGEKLPSGKQTQWGSMAVKRYGEKGKEFSLAMEDEGQRKTFKVERDISRKGYFLPTAELAFAAQGFAMRQLAQPVINKAGMPYSRPAISSILVGAGMEVIEPMCAGTHPRADIWKAIASMGKNPIGMELIERVARLFPGMGLTHRFFGTVEHSESKASITIKEHTFSSDSTSTGFVFLGCVKIQQPEIFGRLLPKGGKSSALGDSVRGPWIEIQQHIARGSYSSNGHAPISAIMDLVHAAQKIFPRLPI